jgi:hypothetical protein
VSERVDEFFAALHVVGGARSCKLIPDGRYAGLMPFLFTHAIVTGRLFDLHGYDDRWCYHDSAAAARALADWDGTGEPTGWHRHPATGRRREAGDPLLEYVAP